MAYLVERYARLLITLFWTRDASDNQCDDERPQPFRTAFCGLLYIATLGLEGMIVYSKFFFPRCRFDLAVWRLDEAVQSCICVVQGTWLSWKKVAKVSKGWAVVVPEQLVVVVAGG